MVKRKNSASHLVGACVMLIIACLLVPMIVDQVQNVDTSTWNFTGSIAAKTLLGMIPFVFIAGIVIFFIVGLIHGKY